MRIRNGLCAHFNPAFMITMVKRNIFSSSSCRKRTESLPSVHTRPILLNYKKWTVMSSKVSFSCACVASRGSVVHKIVTSCMCRSIELGWPVAVMPSLLSCFHRFLSVAYMKNIFYLLEAVRLGSRSKVGWTLKMRRNLVLMKTLFVRSM